MDFHIRKLMPYRSRFAYRTDGWGRGPRVMKVLFGGDTLVRTTDLTCSAERVEALLNERFLRSTDLVKIDGAWMTLADAPHFADAAAPHAQHEARVRFLVGALLVLAAAIPYALLFLSPNGR